MLSRSRATRYELEAPVLYRTGRDEWSAGTTVNASSSGVLISGALPAACAESVTVVIVLPSSGGCLTACGRITRVSDADLSDGNGTFAIAVPQFSVERQSAALARLRVLHQGC
jgi:hypothetical protein